MKRGAEVLFGESSVYRYLDSLLKDDNISRGNIESKSKLNLKPQKFQITDPGRRHQERRLRRNRERGMR